MSFLQQAEGKADKSPLRFILFSCASTVLRFFKFFLDMKYERRSTGLGRYHASPFSCQASPPSPIGACGISLAHVKVQRNKRRAMRFQGGKTFVVGGTCRRGECRILRGRGAREVMPLTASVRLVVSLPLSLTALR